MARRTFVVCEVIIDMREVVDERETFDITLDGSVEECPINLIDFHVCCHCEGRIGDG